MEAEPPQPAPTLTGDCEELLLPPLLSHPGFCCLRFDGVWYSPEGLKKERKTYQCPCSPDDKPKGTCTFYNQAAESCICGAPQGRLSRRVMSSSPQGQAGGPDGVLLVPAFSPSLQKRKG